ncbi:MAG: hypothetical protein KA146_05730 [Leptospiraceae bacterium]|nr:hypothetical protein [Leptospiraceae bacterium]
MNTDVLTVISNLAYAIGLFMGNIAEREKSIRQRNEDGKERLFTTKNTKFTKKERVSGRVLT